jgi:hypothetical protein
MRTCPTSARSPPRTAAAVRPERLRRDPAGTVRVRREADGGQLRDRRPEQRVLQGRRPRRVGGGLPGGDGGVRADVHDGPLVCALRRGPAHPGDPGCRRRTIQGGEESQEGEGQKAEKRICGRRRWPRRRPGGRRRASPRRTPATARRRCPSSARRPAGNTGSSASRRSSSRPATWPPPTGCPRTRSCRCCTSSSAPTGPPCKTTGASCWRSSKSWTRRARWLGSAAWGPGRSSSCCRDATRATRCSCRSRRRPRRCWRRTCPRAASASTVSVRCRASG